MRWASPQLTYWNFRKIIEKNGAGDRTRTYDPIITNDVLYQLSYTGILLIDGPTMALLKPQPAA